MDKKLIGWNLEDCYVSFPTDYLGFYPLLLDAISGLIFRILVVYQRDRCFIYFLNTDYTTMKLISVHVDAHWPQ